MELPLPNPAGAHLKNIYFDCNKLAEIFIWDKKAAPVALCNNNTRLYMFSDYALAFVVNDA